ncbi:MAG: Extracellular ligand-binding receptor [Thermoleophilia bacterium]|nr:Extracellular ligand-binding receptor [Thermoleophilia bacterium]
MKRRAIAVIATILAAAMIAAGCGSDDKDSKGGSDSKSSFDGSMKIGAIVPLTGDLAQFGEPGNAALELATEVANDALDEAGLKGKVELLVEDGETKEDAAKAAAEKLVNDDVSCIVGDWASSSTEAVANSVTIDEDVPLISPASTAGSITTLEDNNTVFRTVPSDNLQAQVLAEAIAKEIGDGGKVTVAARNNAYGSGLASAFVEAGETAGLTVREPILMDPDAPQPKSEAADITKEAADAFLLIDYPEAFIKLGPELVKTGKWDPAKTWGSDGLKSTDLPKTGGPELTEGMRGTAPTSAEAPAAEAFDTLWNEGGDRPERQTYDADNFDALLACVLAAVAAGSSDPADVAAKLADVSGEGDKFTFENFSDALKAAKDGDDVDYEGAASPLDWDENGDPQSAFYEIWSYKGGKVTTLETIPFGAAAEGSGSGDDAAATTEGEDADAGATESEAGEGEAPEGDTSGDTTTG